MQYIAIMSIIILVLCIILAITLSQKLPKKPNVQFEIELGNDKECSIEKVVLNLVIANEIEDIEKTIQQKI